MPTIMRGPYDEDTYIVSSNASAITWSGNPPTYSSGGIQYGVFVKLDTSASVREVIICTSGAGVFPLGVALDYPAKAPGDTIQVQTQGVARCLCNGAVSIGDLLYVADSSGRVGTAPAAGASDYFIVGQAETATTETADYVQVRLRIGAATNVNA